MKNNQLPSIGYCHFLLHTPGVPPHQPPACDNAQNPLSVSVIWLVFEPVLVVIILSSGKIAILAEMSLGLLRHNLK